MNNDKLDLQSTDITAMNIEKIAALFPNCVTETADGKRIDFDLLKQELSAEIVEGNKERYRLEWPGKREAIVTANIPTNKTLRPVREDSVDFDTTENIYIEGDNLEVLKLLQESYLNKIKMIYIDPPYNTGKDFVYKDNFTKSGEEELLESGQKDEYGQRLQANPETSGRYHSDWLSMMYPRLKLARNLLTEDGVIFISIDDNEVHNLRKICDEAFGEGNFLGCFTIKSTPNARDYGHIGKMHEYALFYAKNYLMAETNHLPDEEKSFSYSDEKGGFNIHPLYNSNEAFHKGNRPNLYYPFYLDASKKMDNGFYYISLKRERDNFVEIYPPQSLKNQIDFVWRWGKDKSSMNINEEIVGHLTSSNEFRIVQKMRTSEKVIRSLLDSKGVSSRRGTAEVENTLDGKIFSFPKPIQLVSDFTKVATQTNDIILDFFSGSATTAHAVMQLNAEDQGNRKYIMVQLPEATDEKSEAYKAGYKNICEIGKERIRRAANKIKEEKIEKAKKEGLFAEFKDEQDYGFRVYRLDSSNMQDVYYKPQDYKQGTLDMFADNVKEDRSAEDLVAQIMLDWGLELSLPIERKTIAGKEVYAVAGDSLYCCFDKGIDEAFAKEVAKDQPLRIVFRDNGFKDDTAKENVKQLLKQLSPNTEMKVV